MKTKKFDAVTESRRCKAAVSQKTRAMNRKQVLAFFDKDKAIYALAQMRGPQPNGKRNVCEQ